LNDFSKDSLAMLSICSFVIGIILRFLGA